MKALGSHFSRSRNTRGVNRVGASRLQKIAEILEAPISFFFEEGPSAALKAEGWISDTPTELMTSKDCVALVRAFIAIDDKKIQQKVLSLVRSLSTDKSAPAELQHQASQTH